MNNNCLEGLRCPQCAAYEPFSITATTTAEMHDDGCELTTDIEWDDESPCSCLVCNYDATVGDFKDPES